MKFPTQFVLWIMIGHYKDPYESTSILESKNGIFFRGACELWIKHRVLTRHHPDSMEDSDVFFFVLVLMEEIRLTSWGW